MTKPEWGIKRTCQNCGARFYDLKRDPIACPKCGAVYEPDAAVVKTRRGPAEERKKVAPAVVVEAPDLDTEIEPGEMEDVPVEEEDIEDAVDSEDEEDETLIEDASDLGEDDDDMAEVIEHIDEDEEETER